MPIIDTSEVNRIAFLARLAIDAGDTAHYARELSSILDLVEVMNRVDTSDVAPMANPLESTQRLRADVVVEGDQREAFQKTAPATDSGLYLVPQVLD